MTIGKNQIRYTVLSENRVSLIPMDDQNVPYSNGYLLFALISIHRCIPLSSNKSPPELLTSWSRSTLTTSALAQAHAACWSVARAWRLSCSGYCFRLERLKDLQI